jgi:hypothetical protein
MITSFTLNIFDLFVLLILFLVSGEPLKIAVKVLYLVVPEKKEHSCHKQHSAGDSSVLLFQRQADKPAEQSQHSPDDPENICGYPLAEFSGYKRAVLAFFVAAEKACLASVTLFEFVIKDPELLDINDLIKFEKAEGRAKHVLQFPRWMVVCGYYAIKLVFGKSNKTYLVFKALWPFRTVE